MAELTRQSRLAVTERLDALAEEIEQIGRWLDRYGDDADKGSVLAECAARDLRAACWILKPADHTRPDDWLGAGFGTGRQGG